MKRKIKKIIFELLKEISNNGNHSGLLIVFSDINNVLSRGAYPIGTKEKSFEIVGNIQSAEAMYIIKKVGNDGAVLIDKKGDIHHPSVYLNVSLFSVDENEIDPEFCARHIAALATSAATKACVYTLSEETNKVREFIKGKIKREYPRKAPKKIMEIIEKDLQKEKFKDKIVKIEI